MERTDYIEKREDIISNIETLYSYLHGESGEDYKKWAVDKLKRGKNMVVEVINGHICFAPSRFVGYLNNTREKHDDNHGNGLIPIRFLKLTTTKYRTVAWISFCRRSWLNMMNLPQKRNTGFITK